MGDPGRLFLGRTIFGAAKEDNFSGGAERVGSWEDNFSYKEDNFVCGEDNFSGGEDNFFDRLSRAFAREDNFYTSFLERRQSEDNFFQRQSRLPRGKTVFRLVEDSFSAWKTTLKVIKKL